MAGHRRGLVHRFSRPRAVADVGPADNSIAELRSELAGLLGRYSFESGQGVEDLAAGNAVVFAPLKKHDTWPQVTAAHELTHQRLVLSTNVGCFMRALNVRRHEGDGALLSSLYRAQWLTQEATATVVGLGQIALSKRDLKQAIKLLPSGRSGRSPYREAFEMVDRMVDIRHATTVLGVNIAAMFTEALGTWALSGNVLGTFADRRDVTSSELTEYLDVHGPDERFRQMLHHLTSHPGAVWTIGENIAAKLRIAQDAGGYPDDDFWLIVSQLQEQLDLPSNEPVERRTDRQEAFWTAWLGERAEGAPQPADEPRVRAPAGQAVLEMYTLQSSGEVVSLTVDRPPPAKIEEHGGLFRLDAERGRLDRFLPQRRQGTFPSPTFHVARTEALVGYGKQSNVDPRDQPSDAPRPGAIVIRKPDEVSEAELQEMGLLLTIVKAAPLIGDVVFRPTLYRPDGRGIFPSPEPRDAPGALIDPSSRGAIYANWLENFSGPIQRADQVTLAELAAASDVKTTALAFLGTSWLSWHVPPRVIGTEITPSDIRPPWNDGFDPVLRFCAELNLSESRLRSLLLGMGIRGDEVGYELFPFESPHVGTYYVAWLRTDSWRRGSLLQLLSGDQALEVFERIAEKYGYSAVSPRGTEDHAYPTVDFLATVIVLDAQAQNSASP